MDQLNKIARKAVARAIEEGLIEATDREARNAVIQLALAMASLAKPEILIDALNETGGFAITEGM